MVEHIQTAVFNQIPPGKFHDLPDLCFIFTMGTWDLTFLTHGFRIMRAFHPHGQTVCQKTRANGTKKDLFLFNLLDVESFEGKGRLHSMMIFPAEDPYKF